MPEPDTPSLRRLSAVAYAGMFVFGIVMALLGAIMPALQSELGFAVADIGTLFLFMNLFMLVTSLLLGVVMDRFGMKVPLTLGPMAVVAALVLITQASTYSALLPAVACLGVGGAAVNGASNTLIADLHPDARRKNSALNVLGIFFGFGALLLPFTLGTLVSAVGMTGLLLSTAVLCAFVGAYAAMPRFPAPKQPRKLPVAEMPRFLRMRVVLALAFLLFFQSGNEFLLGGYFTTYLTRDLQTSAQSASYFLAGYWTALMVTRVALSRILLRYDGHIVILISALGAACAAFAVGYSSQPWAAGAAMMMTGAALSGIFPTVLGLAGADFQEHSGTVFGILFAIALTGGMSMPWAGGYLAQTVGLSWVFFLAAANFVGIALMNEVSRRARASSRRPSVSRL
jgi:fucose permease